MANFKAFLHKPISKALGTIFSIILVILFFNFSFLPKSIEQYWSAQNDAVQYQRKQWGQQKITKYNLGIKLGDYFNECNWDVTIDHGVSVQPSKLQTMRGDCNGYSQITIEYLFSQIENMLAKKKCGQDGCECTGPRHMDAIYDETYHFPKSAKPAHHTSWRYRNTNIFGIPEIDLNLLLNGRPACLLYTDIDGNFGWDVYKFVPIQSPRP